MAQTNSSDTGGWGAGLKDVLFGVADRAIAYEQAKKIDVETIDDGNNIPDRNDLIHGQGDAVASDMQGGYLQPSFAGFTLSQWGLVGVAVVAGGLVLRGLLK